MSLPLESPLETRRKRLKFRSLRRGFKEVDLVFGVFAASDLPSLTEAGMDQLEALLAVPDQDVWLWLQGKKPVEPEFDTPVFARLQALCQRKDPSWVI
jgi:antitoxin CptB